MPRQKVLTLVMAGGAGGRMEPLTKLRAKPVLPFAGSYRLIDFPLSNCVHSDLADVWVVEQYQPHALNEHLANGRPWDLDRTYGGLRIMPPYQGAGESGWHQGNADAIYHHRSLIRAFDPALVLVISADHVYRLDYQTAIAFHLDHNADVTMVTTEVPRERAGRHGNLRVGAQGRVTQFAYKPEQPLSETVATEVFVYQAARLLSTLDELVGERGGADEQESGLSDFGHELIPRLVDQGRAFAFPLEGYWRDLGTIGSYWLAHMEQLAPHAPIVLDDPAWPILTYGVQRRPAYVEAGAQLAAAMLAPGCVVRGTVERAVLGPGVVVEAGAVVRDAVVFADTYIEAGATVERAIVDSRVRIGPGARVGAPGRANEEGEELNKEIAVVGHSVRIGARAHVPPGARLQPERQHELGGPE